MEFVIFYDKVNEFYYLTNKYSDEELDARLEKQVKFFIVSCLSVGSNLSFRM